MGITRLNEWAAGGTALTVVSCADCSVTFAITTEYEALRRDDKAMFYCPNGHKQWFPGERDSDRKIAALQRELDAAKRQADLHRRSREWAESRAKGANIATGKAKAALRRTLTRVHAGVCPDCRRTFKQLAAHMKSKHGKS